MNTMKLAAGILFFTLASKANVLVFAQEAGQSSRTNARQVAPSQRDALLSDTQAANASRTRLDKRVSSAAVVMDQVGDSKNRVPEQARTTAPSDSQLWNSDSDECCNSSCYDSDPCSSVYIQIGFLYMQQQPRLNRQAIVVDDNSNTTLLSTSDLNLNFQPGVQATIGTHLCGGQAVEFDYFGLYGGSATALATAPDANATLIFQNFFNPNVFFDMDSVQVEYSSQVHSFAANFVRCCGCCNECCDECCNECGGCNECGCCEQSCQSLTWLAGFRYINLDQELNIAVRTNGEDGSYNTRATNQLYGGQIGSRLRRTRGRFGWEATGFAGIFGNDAQQSQTVVDFPNFQRRDASSRRGAVAFLGQANLSGLYELTDIWRLRTGYSALWIDRLALAPNQLDFDFTAANGGTQLNNRGELFVHGANIGLEARW